jgi:hypothetical protein
VIVSAMEAMTDEVLYAPDKINVPVLAILAKSPFWQADTEQFLHSLAPDLEFQMWEGVGHFVMLEKPKQFNDAVIAFLNKKNLSSKHPPMKGDSYGRRKTDSRGLSFVNALPRH